MGPYFQHKEYSHIVYVSIFLILMSKNTELFRMISAPSDRKCNSNWILGKKSKNKSKQQKKCGNLIKESRVLIINGTRSLNDQVPK